MTSEPYVKNQELQGAQESGLDLPDSDPLALL